MLHEDTEFLALITWGIQTNMYNRQLHNMFGKTFANAMHSRIIYPWVSMFDLDPSCNILHTNYLV